MIRAILFDLDGVVRHFDPYDTIEAECDALVTNHGEAARGAAAFASVRCRVDDTVIELVRRLRGRYTDVLATNGTDRVEAELQELGIDGDFDGIFNSARIGSAKPDRRIFERAATTLDIAPSNSMFIDDSEFKLAVRARSACARSTTPATTSCSRNYDSSR